MKVCYTCDDSTPRGSRLGAWLAGVRGFWRARPWAAALFANSYAIAFVACILFAVVDALRPYAALPFAVFIVCYGLGEYIPLHPMPFSSANAANTGRDKYVGMMWIVTRLLVMIFFFALVLELLAPTTPEAFAKQTVSTALLAVPMVSLAFTLVAG